MKWSLAVMLVVVACSSSGPGAGDTGITRIMSFDAGFDALPAVTRLFA